MKEYGMFSDAGDSAVSKIVECAETAGLSWDIVVNMLSALSADECYAEAMDTAVREAVYCELFETV
jgi:hypothetical protein